MARLNVLEEELSYPKKTWKGFTSTLQSKVLRCLRKSKGIIKTTQHLLSNNLCHHHHHHHHHHHVYFHHYDHHDNDELSPEPVSVNDRYVHKEVEAKAAPVTTAPPPQQQEPLGIAKIEGHGEDNLQDGNGSNDDDENDEYILVGTPDSERLLLHGVNAESEKFIRSFYERLKLERQTTIEEEFEEMLDHRHSS